MRLHDLEPAKGVNTGRYDQEWFMNLPFEGACNLEIAGVAENLQPDGTTACERLDGTDIEPDFWSVYFHTDDPEHLVEVLGDYPTYEAAKADAEAILAEWCPHAYIEDYA